MIIPQSKPIHAAAIIYLAAPLHTFATPAYDAALARLRASHPLSAILSPREIWTSSAAWKATYEQVLASITHFYLLTDAHGYAGEGCKVENDYAAHIKAKRIALLPNGKKWTGFTLVPSGLSDPCRSWLVSHNGKLSGQKLGIQEVW